MKSDIKNLIGREKIVITDGAMGTYLTLLGYKGKIPETANLSNPEIIEKIHQDYISAGAEIILTNTFGANKPRLLKHKLETKLEEINKIGVKIALKIKMENTNVLIAGDIGPTGEILQPYGSLSKEEAINIFLQQGKILQDNGVDFILLETFTDLNELKIAYQTLKKHLSIFILPSFSLSPGKEYKTVMGQSLEEIVKWVETENVEVLGINCGIGSSQMKEVIKRLVKLTNIPLWVKPNAGMPILKNGEVFYPESPDEFSENCLEMVKSGVKFIGGCCGTTPSYIAFIHKTLSR